MATNVYRGSDGTISVAVETGPEGDNATAINDEYATHAGRAGQRRHRARDQRREAVP